MKNFLSVVFLSSLLPITFASSPSSTSTSDGGKGGKDKHDQHKIDRHWMRYAISKLPSKCYFDAFAAVIVNSTDNTPICHGYNHQVPTGDPTEHGEINAIRNCVRFLRDGLRLTTPEIDEVWKYSHLYTTAEPCPMCAATILQSGIQRFIYGTSSEDLYSFGWKRYLITVRSKELVERAKAQEGFEDDKKVSEVEGGVAKEECDALFKWQFSKKGKCPKGCDRNEEGICEEVPDDGDDDGDDDDKQEL